MRILRGEFKGRKLLPFKGDHLRPTTDRVKESVFNIIQDFLPDAMVLDLFSGTGNLTIESISQGAASAVSVDASKKSIKIMNDNFRHFEVQDRVKVLHQDVPKFVKGYSGKAFDIIFIDPPFTKKMADEVMSLVGDSTLFDARTVVVIESTVHEKIDIAYGELRAVDTRTYGDKLVTFFRPQQEARS